MEQEPNNKFIEDNMHDVILDKLDEIDEKVDIIVDNITEEDNTPVQNPFDENAMDIDYETMNNKVESINPDDMEIEKGGKKKRRYSSKKNGKKSRTMKKGGRKSLKTKKNQKGGRNSRKNVLRK